MLRRGHYSSLCILSANYSSLPALSLLLSKCPTALLFLALLTVRHTCVYIVCLAELTDILATLYGATGHDYAGAEARAGEEAVTEAAHALGEASEDEDGAKEPCVPRKMVRVASLGGAAGKCVCVFMCMCT